jgi:hypothetical protein
MASQSYDTVSSLLTSLGLPQLLPQFQQEVGEHASCTSVRPPSSLTLQELDDSILDDVQIPDLAQVGLTAEQAGAFIAEYRLHSDRTGGRAPSVAEQTAQISGIALTDAEVDPDAILPPSRAQRPQLPPPRRQRPPLPPPRKESFDLPPSRKESFDLPSGQMRRESSDVPSGQMSITVKFSVVSPNVQPPRV